MTITPALPTLHPSTRDRRAKGAFPISHDRHFDYIHSRASTSVILSDSVLSEIDSALTLFTGVLMTRQDFIVTATLFALDSIHNDPKLALRKLAATGAMTTVARMDDKHGRVDGESL